MMASSLRLLVVLADADGVDEIPGAAVAQK